MEADAIGLFLHIVGAIGFCVALALEWTGLRQLRSALLPEQVRAWMGIFKGANKLGLISMLMTVLTGVYMIFIEWGFVAWIVVSLVTLLLVIMMNLVLTRPLMMDIGRALRAEKGAVSETFRKLVNHPLLWISIQTRVVIVLGLVLTMIAKPDLTVSLLILGISIILGVASVIPVLRRERVQQGLTG